MLKDYNLRPYQKEIIKTIIDKINKNKKEIFIEMPTGTGKGVVIKSLIKKLIPEKSFLILVGNKTIENQYVVNLKEYKNVEINNYYGKEFINKEFSYVILDNAERISEEKYISICEKYKNSILIFFCDKVQRIDENTSWIDKKTIDYSITLETVLEEGYINPYQTESNFLNFIEKLFYHLDILEVEKDVKLQIDKGVSSRIDFVLENDNKKILVEVKNYRSNFVQNATIYEAVEQIQYYKQQWNIKKKENAKATLIVSCNVPEEVKQLCYKEKDILIIDMSNLLYLVQDNYELMTMLMENIQYSIYNSIPKPLLNSDIFNIKKLDKNNKSVEEIIKVINYIYRLKHLPYGKDESNDKKYEKLCVEIIEFLFKTEFTKMIEQNSTEDEMFRMDLVCGIKGSSEFWKILVQHYNTRFVVFEFKNCKDEINQNLIYITEKYLYNAVLRNVAIIISRNGFSHNASKASTGILTENGKLIIDLNDNDIITMLRLKADKQDPSDYMLDKLENYLMSISK